MAYKITKDGEFADFLNCANCMDDIDGTQGYYYCNECKIEYCHKCDGKAERDEKNS